MFAVIMAGGSGTRFWPASRESLPKQFLRITSDRTMFEETLARVRLFAPDDRIYSVVGSAHAELVSGLLNFRPTSHILTEPFGRNTAACIGLSAIHISRRDPDEPIAFLPADHFVADAECFARTIQAAAKAARSGAIITLGIKPTRPETGYGYIEIGAEAGRVLDQPYFRMERFVEKPDQETALRYLSGGRHLWNSGIFIFTARTILNELNNCLPALNEGLREIDSAIGRTDYSEVISSVYERIQSISIDYGVMERTSSPVLVFKADFGWSDVGSWQALYELRKAEYDEQDNLIVGDALAIESKGNFVYAQSKRVVTLLGVENLVVVDTGDAVLIARLDRSQDVKKFPELLKKRSDVA
jgi:mannose-1-phosphate guanylyltransferase